MRNTIFAFLLIALWFAFPREIRAQNEIYFSDVEIELWPEFDRPEMLVIFNLQLAEDVSLPAELILRIPSNVGEPFALADSVNGDKSYTREVQGKWANIQFTANGSFIQLEYYDTNLKVENIQRRFELIWPVDYPISSFRMKIKLPEDVRSLQVPSGFSGPASGEEGYIYYETSGSKMSVGEEVRASLYYTRGTDTQLLLAWALGIVGVALIIWGGYRYIRVTKQPNRSRIRRTLFRAKLEKAIFCHKCGTKAKAGDSFCRSCGTQLRSR